MNTNINMADYSAKAFILYGEGTRPLKDQLKSLGGRYNPFLKMNDQPVKGWVFGNSRKEAVSKLIEGVNTPKPVAEVSLVEDKAPDQPLPVEVKKVTAPPVKKEESKAPINWVLPDVTPKF